MLCAWQTIKVEQDKEVRGVRIISLNRPDALNALNTQMALELIDCMEEFKKDDDVRVVVITGSGNRSFCVGADLKERNGMTNKQWKEQHDVFENAYSLIRNFEFPVIAAINGYALGGGMEMALSCDLRIVSEHAKMGLPEVKIGIIPGCGGTQLLPRSVPIGIAKEFLFRGSHITAERAKEIGLANEVTTYKQLLTKTIEIAREVGRNAPLSLKAIKQAVNNGMQTDLNTALTIELAQYYKCANSEDRLEGIMAFNEKREPNWEGN